MLYKNGWRGKINYTPKFGDNTTSNSSFEPIASEEKTKVCKSCDNVCLYNDIFCSQCGEKL